MRQWHGDGREVGGDDTTNIAKVPVPADAGGHRQCEPEGEREVSAEDICKIIGCVTVCVIALIFAWRFSKEMFP